MTNVIGPIPHEDWYLMRMLRGNIKFYEDKNDERYDIAERKVRSLYKENLNRFKTKGTSNEPQYLSDYQGAA
jgi:hypothetical protein